MNAISQWCQQMAKASLFHHGWPLTLPEGESPRVWVLVVLPVQLYIPYHMTPFMSVSSVCSDELELGFGIHHSC